MCNAAVILLSLISWSAAASTPDHVECNDPYEIAAAAAVPVLPTPLRTFFEVHVEALRKAAVPGARIPSGSKFTSGDEQWHYVSLDVAAGSASRSEPRPEGSGPSLEDRRASARRFPRERDKATALYESCGTREGGLLPWVVEDRYESLVQAFRHGEAEKIVVEAGVLLHFAVDAAMPFNTTAFFSIPGPDPPPDNPLRRMQNRYHGDLVRRLRKRLDYEVRVSPDRLSPIQSALDATFEVLLGAHRVADELMVLDAGVAAELGVREDEALPAAREALADRLAERAAPILESRIEAGALLAANLIASAWTEAGKPELKAAAVVAPPSPAPAPPVATGGFVGSRNSTVYHRSTCPHAAKIKPENRVIYESVEKAKAASRTPCKTCKPDAPAKP
jgi:hypothetical protein